MKRRFNLIALVILVSVNMLTPISYAQENAETVEGATENQEATSENPADSFDAENNEVVPQNPEAEENIEESATLSSAMDIISAVVEEYKEAQKEEPEADGENKVGESNNPEEIVAQVEENAVEPNESTDLIASADEGIIESKANGDSITSGCFTYTILDEESKQIEITKYNENNDENCPKVIDLSDGVDGYNVISIADRAFYQKGITGLELGDTVESIGEWAFGNGYYNGRTLEYISLGKNLKYLGYDALGFIHPSKKVYVPMVGYVYLELNLYFPDDFDFDNLEVDVSDDQYNKYRFLINEGEDNCFIFELGTKAIYGYSCEESNLVIPDKINGFTVRSIIGAQGGCGLSPTLNPGTVKTIQLPESVEMIGDGAGCSFEGVEWACGVEDNELLNQNDMESLSIQGEKPHIGIKPYPGQELSPELTNEMLSAACMYISEEHVVRFYDENGELIRQITVEGYIDEEDFPVVDQREGFKQLWINQYGQAYAGEVVSEDLMLTLKYKREGIIYENGIIKISDGENEIWLRDRNVGATVSAGLDKAGQIRELSYDLCVYDHYASIESADEISLQAEGLRNILYCSNEFYEQASQIIGHTVTTVEEVNAFLDSYNSLEDNEYKKSFGNYYFWGNNGYATYDEMNFNNEQYSTGISQDAIDRGFIEGGKMDVENTGWEEGRTNNPCTGDGEYLPTSEDWVKLMQIWANSNGAQLASNSMVGNMGTEEGYIYFENYGDTLKFANDMLLPEAGNIDFSPADPMLCEEDLEVQGCDIDEWYYRNNNGSYLWSARDNLNSIGEYNIDGGQIYWDQDVYNDLAHAVRCFVMANSVTVKYVLGNGEEIEQSVEAGNVISPIDVPEKEGYYFLGWYQDSTYVGRAFDFSMPIEEDITLYARRGQIIYNDGDITYTDTNGKVFGGMGTITFTDGINSITMLDRNLGATSTDIDSSDSNGYYFQWGNNHGFLPGENETDIERVDVTGYGRNNPYVSEKFIVNTGQWNYSELSENDEEEYADGLWGGVGDYRDNTWDSSEGYDYMRQGPCPDGYHVPSGGEWIDLITIWSDANNVVTSPNDKLAINTSRHSEYYDFLEDFYVPLMGRMDYNVSISSEPIDGGSIVASIMENVKIKNKNKFAYAWSSSPYYLTADGGYELYGDSRRLAVGPNAKSHGSIERSNGFPVRCFADNYAEGDEPLVLSYDTRGGSAIQAQTIPEGENEYLPGYTTHRTGYELLGWYDDRGKLELDGNKITNRTMESDTSEDGVVTIYARWSDDHVVTFKDYDGSVIKVVLVKNGANAQSPANPTREGYKFTGWDKDLNNVTEDMEVTAQYSSSSNGGYSGGGGSSSKPDKSHNSADDKEILDTKDSSQKVEEQPSQGKTLDTINPSKEIFNAHQWAYSKGLTKYRTAGEARMDDPLNRSEMAKISSIFATEFLDKVPNEKKQEFCSQYPDLWKVEDDMKLFIIESCELGYMGYESNGIDALERFRPYTPVTVAEAATILSRIVWGNDNAMNGKDWYKGHLYATYNHGLIDDIQDPTKRSITRREAYLMLYRLIKDK